MNKPLLVAATMFSVAALAFPALASADTVGPIDFESFSSGNVNQNGWTMTGPYDVSINNNVTGAPASFGTKSLRISDAVTSGSFGDWLFAQPLTNAVGEASSTAGPFSVGTLQPHFEMSFDLAATTSQPGLFVSVSPDRGDGSRMSYLGFGYQADGIHPIFYDVTDPGPIGTVATFNEHDLPVLSTTTPHTVKLTMDTLDGPHNDVVKVWIDGSLVATGTSWEDYYRYDPEAAAEQSPRIVKTVIFQARGTAHPADAGEGYLIDNFSTMSGPIPPATVSVHIFKYVNGALATAGSASSAAFPMLTTFSSTNLGSATDAPFTLSPTGWGAGDAPYEASFNNSDPGADYATHEVTSGNDVVGASCADGKPFALEGYSTGDTLDAAFTNASSTATPSFTDLQGDKYVIVWNKTCAVAPPTTVKVTIDKFIDGSMATAVTADNSAFPMSATWSAANIGSGSGSYALGPTGFNSANPYEAVTSDMSSGASYSTNEDLTGPVAGASCTDSKPFALAGYSTGNTLAAAIANASSTATPSFSNLTSDHFVIVWNKTCALPPPTPTGKNECKAGGWATLVDTDGNHFKNQGDCVSFVATKGKNKAAGH